MQAKENRAACFEALAAGCERQVYFTCLRMMGNRQDAEDCAQEAMIKAFRAFDRFRGDSQFSTWLYSIASRCCLDALRRRKEPLSLESLREAGWEAPCEEPSPYLQLEEGERKRLLEQALKKLSHEQRLCVVLCDIQGLPYQEAAQVMDCPVGTVKSRLSRARQELQNILRREGELFVQDVRPMDEGRESK
ncbi:MAG: sigma-70 family RNA polymerase sigma factor [Clostridiales bacterium]|nr:sigma-70 family RNA polymerase sigma factor [Clostridiales bacterium]